jgi:release factor glutamine methyltransferase
LSVSPSSRISSVAAELRDAGCVFADDEARLLVSAARTPDELAAMVARRVAGSPLEHVLGRAEFCGLQVIVGPGVFIPRRRTEFLVREAVALARPGAVVVDLCCGSGAIGAALAAALATALVAASATAQASASAAAGPIELYAADIDPVALRYARRNIAPAGGRVHQGDLYGALPAGLRGRVDIVLANAPYVPSAALASLPAEARLHEPRLALDGGADGRDVQRRVAAGAPEWLAPGGHLLIETSEHQAPALARDVTRAGLTVRVTASEELSATVVVGRMPGPRPVPG